MEIYKDSSFIKVLSEPVSSNLLFPDGFVRKFGEMLPQEAFLMTEEKYGRCWKVKVARFRNGRFCFANGWPHFVEENPQIRASDFAVFRLVDASTFHVSVFGNDGLKKPSSTNLFMDSNEIGQSSKRGVEVNGTKSFTITSLTKHHLYCLNIPVGFAERTGIAYRGSIVLENENGGRWEVLVRIRENDGRICLRGVDWEDFWVKNCLSFGNRVTFSVVGDDFGTLHVSRQGLITPTLPKKACGRPRKF